jgi:hypothetical protein
MRGRHISVFGLALFFAMFLLIITMSPEAKAIVEYTGNDDSDNAIWIEPPVSLDAVHMWRRSGPDNLADWWRFNASAGMHLQINFRKYEKYQDFEPPYLGGSYSLNYRVYDVSINEIYHYSRGFDWDPDDSYRRDSWSYIIPENQGPNFYIEVWITTNWNTEAYYWLNVTVEYPRDLNAASEYSGTLDINASYTADYDPEDYFLVDLDAGDTTSDFITLDLYKDVVDDDLILEVWETIPYGTGERSHMLNRTTSMPENNIQVRFLATHTGTYVVRMVRSFWDPGSSNYTLSITFGSRPSDPDGLAADGASIEYVQKLRDQTIEMGYDTHDWYRVKVLKGDTVFKVIVDINDESAVDGQGYELVVYNEAGNVRWAASNMQPGPTWDDSITLPPSGTTTIFDANETLYVRFSADASTTERTIKGFRSLYDIEFVLTNRAPVLLVPFNETYEWDEDGGVNINLDAHFFDPDGDTLQYYLLNRTAGWSYDVAGLSYWGWLNVTSPAEWSGQVNWTLKAQDEGQTGDDHKIFIIFHFVVHSVPDLPISNGTLNRQCDEEGTASADLHKLFYDVDKGQGGELTFGYADTGITDVQVDLDPVTGVVVFTPGPDVFGDFTFEFYCMDDTEVHVAGQVKLKVNGVNDIPRITKPIDTIYMDEGGDPVEVNMSQYFHDVDGDELQYSYLVPSPESQSVNVYHKNYVITENRVIIELSNDGFYGTVLVNVTCKDSAGTLVKQNMLIIVSNVPDPPTIDYFPVGNPSPIEESQSLTFKVTDVLDADLPEEGLHTYTWYLDDELIPDFNESEFTYTPGFDDAGTHKVKVIVTDPSGLTAAQQPVWTFQVNDKNRAPTVSIVSPPDTVDEGKKLTLTAEGSDPDSDDLTYTWYLVGGTEDKMLGTGPTLETKALKAGSRMVEVTVSDNKGGENTASHTIKVNAVEDSSGIGGMWLGIVVVIVIVIVIAVVMMMRKGKGPEPEDMGMDLESLQKEYDPSQGRAGNQQGDSYQSEGGEWESFK